MTNLPQPERINVDIGYDKDGNALILIKLGDNVLGLSPNDAAQLCGTIQCMVASIWGIKAWQSRRAAQEESSHTLENVTQFPKV